MAALTQITNVSPSHRSPLDDIDAFMQSRRSCHLQITSETLPLLAANRIAEINTRADIRVHTIDARTAKMLLFGRGQLHLGLTASSLTCGVHNGFTWSQSLTSLDLTSCNAGDGGLALISSSSTLCRLKIISDKIGIGGTFSLARMPTLTSLHIECCQLNDAAATALTASRSITDLNVHDNCITDRGGVPLSSMHLLQSLDITTNRVTARTLQNMARNPSLTSISFDFPKEEGFFASRALSHSPSIREIRCSKIISTRLCEIASNPHLESLSYTPSGDTLSSDAATVFRESRSLKNLEISFSTSTWTIAQREMISLSQMPSLTSLSFMVATISNASLLALSQNKTLRKLSLSIMNRGPLQLNSGIKALVSDSLLESLEISTTHPCKIFDKRAKIAIAKNCTLTDITLCNCCHFSEKSLAQTFRHNRNLLHLEIEDDNENAEELAHRCKQITLPHLQHLRATHEITTLIVANRAIGDTALIRSYILPLLGPRGALTKMFDGLVKT